MYSLRGAAQEGESLGIGSASPSRIGEWLGYALGATPGVYQDSVTVAVQPSGTKM